MSLPETKNTYRTLEESRKKLLETVIKMSLEGKLIWDFSGYDNPFESHRSQAKMAGFTFIFTHAQDEVRLGVYAGEDENLKEVEVYGGSESLVMRDVLDRLALLDPEYRRKMVIKEVNSKKREAERAEADKIKKIELDQVLKQLAV